MYSVADYGGMMADKVRMRAYMQALRQAVTPESVVLDIGTGRGILIASGLGARRVFAVATGDSIELAREIARCEASFAKYLNASR